MNESHSSPEFDASAQKPSLKDTSWMQAALIERAGTNEDQFEWVNNHAKPFRDLITQHPELATGYAQAPDHIQKSMLDHIESLLKSFQTEHKEDDHRAAA
jgi:hypothetical protein